MTDHSCLGGLLARSEVRYSFERSVCEGIEMDYLNSRFSQPEALLFI